MTAGGAEVGKMQAYAPSESNIPTIQFPNMELLNEQPVVKKQHCQIYA